MANPNFRRKAAPSSDEGRFLASRIQDARRKGYSNKIIADSFGINERTVRKIISGETSGKRLYSEHVAPSRGPLPGGASPSIVRLDLVIGKKDGKDVVRTVNAKTTLINGKTPTPFDVLRMPALSAIAAQEIERMKRQYTGKDIVEDDEIDEDSDIDERPRIASIRPIIRRDASKRLVTITGRV